MKKTVRGQTTHLDGNIRVRTALSEKGSAASGVRKVDSIVMAGLLLAGVFLIVITGTEVRKTGAVAELRITAAGPMPENTIGSNDLQPGNTAKHVVMK